jgi:hypothetical protein
MPGEGIPVIKWGTFICPLGVPHVAPAIEMYLMKGHKLSLECDCCPKIVKGPSHTIVVHEIIN